MADEMEANLKKLEEEKKALEEKNKSLAKVIEMTSTQNVTDNGAEKTDKNKQEAAAGTDTQKALEELRGSMKIIKKNLKESLEGPAEKHEQMKKMVTDIEAKVKDIDKISVIETKIGDIEKKVAESVQKTPSSLGNLFGGFGADRTESGAPKNAPRNMAELMKQINGIKEDIDTRMLNMERRVDAIRQKLGKKNLQHLEELISSKQDISDNIVPRRVREEVEKILTTFSFEVEDMAEAAKNLADNVEKSNDTFDHSLDTINELRSRIDTMERMVNEMRVGYQQTSQTVSRLVGKVESMDISGKDVEEVIKEAEKLSEKVEDVEKSLNTIENDHHMKDILRTELSKIAPPPKPKRRSAPKKPIIRKRPRKKPAGKAASKKAHKKRPLRHKKMEASKPADASYENNKKNKIERINSTLRRVEMAYENGLISKERYERITEKLNRLKKLE